MAIAVTRKSKPFDAETAKAVTESALDKLAAISQEMGLYEPPFHMDKANETQVTIAMGHNHGYLEI